MRHLHFTQSLEPLYGGGLGTSAVALHGEMRAGGISSLLCSTHGGSPQYPVEGTLEFCRVKPRALYFSPALQRCAPQLVHESDVLHGHGLYVGTNLIFGRAARRALKPLVYHVHGMFEPYILQRSKWKKQLVHWLFENNNFRHVRLWRALTSKEADQIRACGLRQPIVIAPNGLNVADFPKPPQPVTLIDTPLVRGLRKHGPRALFLGRIHPKKGLDLLLRAWAKIPRAARDWELVIAGAGRTRPPRRDSNLDPISGAAKSSCLHRSRNRSNQECPAAFCRPFYPAVVLGGLSNEHFGSDGLRSPGGGDAWLQFSGNLPARSRVGMRANRGCAHPNPSERAGMFRF